MGVTRIIVFGTGSSAASFLANLDDAVQTVACLDNNSEKQGTIWNGIPVLAPEQVVALDYDYVVIASQFLEPIRDQLLGLGVRPEKILPMYPGHYSWLLRQDYRAALDRLYRKRYAGSERPRIVLLSASRSGCNARALYEYAPETIRRRYDIHLADSQFTGMDVDCVVTTHRNFTLVGNGINVELWHGFPLKAMGRMNNSEEDLPALENWHDVQGVISYSPLYTTLISACFPTMAKQFVVTGAPRNDRLFRSDGRSVLSRVLSQPLGNKKVIFYMPTFRYFSSRGRTEGSRCWTNVFDIPGFDEERFASFLNQNHAILVIKIHPFEEKKWLERIPSRDYFQLLTEQMLEDHDLDLYEILNAVDILITDYSSVFFDYLLLDRPILFVPTDLEQYRRTRGFLLEPYEWWTPGDKALNQEELENGILSALADPGRHAKWRRDICTLVHVYKDGSSSERVWRMIDRLLTAKVN